MIAALTLAAAAMAYGFGPDTTVTYVSNVDFDGMIPVLGGQEGKAEVRMEIRVNGLTLDESGNQRVTSELTDFRMEFNGARMPFTVANVSDFLPKATVLFTPQGEVLENDAPDRDLPVKLPFLHPKRIPDITFLPIQFPRTPVEVGTKWEFERQFGDVPVVYKVEAKQIEGDKATLAVEVSQTYTVLEDESKSVAAKQEDAIAQVKTVVEGTGTIVFDMAKKLVQSTDVQAKSVSTVTDLKDGKSTTRELLIRIRLAPKPASP